MKLRWTKTTLLLAPATLLAALLFVFPVFGVLKLTVHDGTAFTAEALRQVYNSQLSIIVLQRTFVTAATVTVICLVMGYPMAYFMAGLSPRKRVLATYLILLPFWISILVRTYTWIILLGREGILNKALAALGLTAEPVQLLYTPIAVHIGMVQILLPIVILTCLTSILDVERDLVKAARSLGASPRQAFWKVVFPLSVSGAATGGIICFILCLGFYVTPTLLGGRTSLLIANLIDLQVHKTLKWDLAAVMASTLLAATFSCLLAYWALTRKRSEFATGGLAR
ncbi:ABC transporter permease [Bosea sp. 2YAB26]|uniref:ABC transporter permease n=1 Tax=Bosea sp. 2YAB26 TaxID=3237478 RepID=UPI003F93F597